MPSKMMATSRRVSSAQQVAQDLDPALLTPGVELDPFGVLLVGAASIALASSSMSRASSLGSKPGSS